MTRCQKNTVAFNLQGHVFSFEDFMFCFVKREKHQKVTDNFSMFDLQQVKIPAIKF